MVACTANTIGVIACATDRDCQPQERCDTTTHECVVAPAEAGPPTPILVDDFEDGGPYPVDQRFAVWQYYTYNPPDQPSHAGNYAPGYNSNGCELLQWSVTDTPDGHLEYPGAGLRTLVKDVYIDLSQYTRIVFAHRYEPAGTPCSATDVPIQNFQVQFGCDELGTVYEYSVPTSPTWQEITLNLSAFAEPMFPSGYSLTQCLQVTSVLQFVVQPTLADGQCGSGQLFLDDISIR
jgi:hypothetical protein